jgi:quercetin dioxygenase-like cupin family protein
MKHDHFTEPERNLDAHQFLDCYFVVLFLTHIFKCTDYKEKTIYNKNKNLKTLKILKAHPVPSKQATIPISPDHDNNHYGGLIMHLENLKNMKEREIVPGFKGKFIHSDSMTLAYWNISAGAVLPEHAHVHEQVVNVLEGTLEISIEGTAYSLQPGSVMCIPSNVSHSGKAITQCRVLDVFHPVRDEYR